MVKNLPANAVDVRESGLVPGLGRSLGVEHSNPLQYSCLKNPHGSLVGSSPWGCKELDTTELLNPAQHIPLYEDITIYPLSY